MLTPEQKAQFIQDGYVAVSGLIPMDVVDTTREAILNNLQLSLTDPATWPATAVLGASDVIESTLGCRTEAMDDAASELIGDIQWRGWCISPVMENMGKPPHLQGFMPVLAFPRPGEKRFDAENHKQGYHVDGIQFSTLWPEKMLLVALAYLTNTEAYGGATVVRPGSHRQIFEYWAERGELPNYQNIMGEGIPFAPPITIPGKAGDVIFMHHLMVHSGSPNHDAHIRVAINANFTIVQGTTYEVKEGEPTADWMPLDYTMRTDNLPAGTLAGIT